MSESQTFELHDLAKEVLDWTVQTDDGLIIEDEAYQRLLGALSKLRDQSELPWAIESLQRVAYGLSQQGSHILAQTLVEITRTVQKLQTGTVEDASRREQRKKQAALLGTSTPRFSGVPGPRPPGSRGLRAGDLRMPRTFR